MQWTSTSSHAPASRIIVVCDAPEGASMWWGGMRGREIGLNDDRSLTAKNGEVSDDRRNVDVLILQQHSSSTLSHRFSNATLINSN